MITVFVTIFGIAFFAIVFFALSTKKHTKSFLIIDPCSKDKKISFIDYRRQIDEFLFLIKFQKHSEEEYNQFTYTPFSMNRIYYYDLTLKVEPFYMEVRGDENLVKLLSETLKSDGSHFEVKEVKAA
jgi:hypothetical protein